MASRAHNRKGTLLQVVFAEVLWEVTFVSLVTMYFNAIQREVGMLWTRVKWNQRQPSVRWTLV